MPTERTALGNTDLDHLNGLDGIVVAGGDLANLLDEVKVLGDLAEDGVSRGSGAIEPVQEGVVGDVDEELRATGLGLAGVGHREGPDVVGDFCRELVGDATVVSAGDGLAIAGLEGGVGGGAAGSGTVAVGILGVGATELVHEIRDNAVEVDAIVEAAVGKVDEVAAGDGHLVGVELGLEGAHLNKRESMNERNVRREVIRCRIPKIESNERFDSMYMYPFLSLLLYLAPMHIMRSKASQILEFFSSIFKVQKEPFAIQRAGVLIRLLSIDYSIRFDSQFNSFIAIAQ